MARMREILTGRSRNPLTADPDFHFAYKIAGNSRHSNCPTARQNPHASRAPHHAAEELFDKS